MTGSGPAVSVVMPAYNAAAWIAEAIGSVQAQTSPDWDLVVVDDGSTDDTARIAAELAEQDSRIRVVGGGVNRGVAWALNEGIRQSSGRFVQMLAADDLIEPGKLESQAAFLDANADVGIVYSDPRYFETETPARLERTHGLSGGRDALLAKIARNNIFPIQAALVRRTLFNMVGLHDEALRSHEDYDWLLRAIIFDVRVAYRPAAGARVLIRRSPGSLSADRRAMYRSKVAVHRKTRRLLHGRARVASRAGEAAALRSLAAVEAASGRRGVAGWCLLRAALMQRDRRSFRLVAGAPLAVAGRWPR